MVTKGDILVVDDDSDFRDPIQLFLEKSGYSVRTAKNGEEAMEALNYKVPDLMILDIMMTTDTEGFDLAFEIKEHPLLANVPVIILTSFLDKMRTDGPEQYQHVLGEPWPAKRIFEKPLDMKLLLSTIEGILTENRE